MRCLSRAALTIVLISIPALAWAPPWPIPILLDAIPVSDCGVVWEEPAVPIGAELILTATEAGDCSTGLCAWETIPGGIDLLGARLDVRLGWGGGIGGIFDVWVAIEDHCGVGCTRVLLYFDELFLGETSNQTTGAPEFIATGWGSGEASGNRLIIVSCGAKVHEITVWLLGDAVEGSAWSTIKALY
jgi:hypothetical protein